MNLPTLGNLSRKSPREVWPTEHSDFTPWLAREENLKLLGDTIGLELELEAQEKEVGPFRADILCKDVATGHWVLIENQLERTDHTHLGQLITYAAGLKAVTIIWIANPFTEEHRAALDWLNSVTGSELNFFGLEVELWQIGDSLAAPKFNLVSKPNDWSRSVSEASTRGELTESKQTQLKFWTQFRDFISSTDTGVRTTKPQPQHWMAMGIGRSGFDLNAVASFWNSETESWENNEVRVELVLHHKNAKEYFSKLKAEKDNIEKDLGCALIWHSKPETKMCRIYDRRTIENLHDSESWPEINAWLLKKLEDFRRVFTKRVKALPVHSE